MAKAAYPTIGIAALVMFGIVYFIGCLRNSDKVFYKKSPDFIRTLFVYIMFL